jgi:hypothetical protein
MVSYQTCYWMQTTAIGIGYPHFSDVCRFDSGGLSWGRPGSTGSGRATVSDRRARFNNRKIEICWSRWRRLRPTLPMRMTTSPTSPIKN